MKRSIGDAPSGSRDLVLAILVTHNRVEVAVGAGGVFVLGIASRRRPGASPEQSDDVNLRVTLHHNHFEKTNQRHPRLRYGKVHAFNNYLEDWGSYGMGSSQLGQLRVERNIFEAKDSIQATLSQVGDDPDNGFISIHDGQDLLLNGAQVAENAFDEVFNPSDHYTFSPEVADTALKSKIEAEAGRQAP